LQFPVPTPIFLLRASKVNEPSRIAAIMVPALMFRHKQTFLILSKSCFFVSKIYRVPAMILMPDFFITKNHIQVLL